MRKKFRIRMDNNGLSLVELLIAVVILAVIVAPLLHAFVTAARVNAISKKEVTLWIFRTKRNCLRRFMT